MSTTFMVPDERSDGAVRRGQRFMIGKAAVVCALGVVALAPALSSCGSCKALTNVEEARADLEQEIRKKPRRFYIEGHPTQIVFTSKPAGDQIASQGGWFFRVDIISEGTERILYLTNFGCGRIDVAREL
jgi:hypothetical protein